MKRSWRLQEAKARLSEVVKAAVKEGPQEITVRGETAAVLLSERDYARLARPKPEALDGTWKQPPLVKVP